MFRLVDKGNLLLQFLMYVLNSLNIQLNSYKIILNKMTEGNTFGTEIDVSLAEG